MHTIKFGTTVYNLVDSEAGAVSEKDLKIVLAADHLSLDSVEETISDKESVKIITKFNDNKEPIEIFENYTTLKALSKIEKYPSSKGLVNTIVIYLSKPSLNEQIIKNSVDIEYLAALSDIQL